MSRRMVIVLAMHGIPPADFPRRELDEFFALHMRYEHGAVAAGPGYERYEELETKLKYWPRTEDNDPYQAASFELAGALSRAADCEVVVGFNEFCAPDLDEALDKASATDTDAVFVVTPMMTHGGEHSERDIPAAISRARQRHPGRRIVYAWPFPVADVAAFLAGQVLQFANPVST